MQKEIWKDIPDYEGLYQVSNLGRIKSFKNYGKINERILVQRIKRNYYTVGLRKKAKRKWYSVHRLVAKAFIPNPNNLPQVNHKNENKLDNRVENLEWCDALYNNVYGTRLKRVSESNKLRKEVLKFDLNGNFIEKYFSVIEATRKNNIKSVSSVSNCCNKKIPQTHGFIFKFESEVMPNANRTR